ncbi:hypothetical protein VTK26DRAFT_8542 [Humicola hyalothermophila]
MIRETELSKSTKISQREFGHLLNLTAESKSGSAHFAEEVAGLQAVLAKKLGSPEGAIRFFYDRINHLNKHPFHTGNTPVEETAESGAEEFTILGLESTERLVAFVKELHTANSAANMFVLAFENARQRLKDLASPIECEERWLSGDMLYGLIRTREMAEEVVRWDDLVHVVSRLLTVAENWRDNLRRWYSVPRSCNKNSWEQ